MILRKLVASLCFCVFLTPSGASEECPYSQLLKAKYYDQAIKCASSKKDNVHELLFKWLKYKDGDGSFENVTSFLMDKPNIPSFSELAKSAEEKLDDDTKKSAIKRWFSKHPPITPNGIRYYTKVILNKHVFDQNDINMIKKAFIRGEFSNQERDEFFHKHRKHISKEDVLDRVMYTIWYCDRKVEKQYMSLLDNDRQALLRGVIRVLNNEQSIDSLGTTVPESLRQHPDLLYSKALWYKRRAHNDKLAELLMSTPSIKDRNDDRWFKIRIGVAIDLMDKGDFQNAYKIISLHNYSDPVNYVDAEWLAGRLAYIYLKKPREGFTHFKNIVDKSQYSISISKGSYWSGLAARDINMPSLSKSYLVKAAKYPDTYYGQLSLIKLGYAGAYKVAEDPKVTPEDLKWVQNNTYIKIAHALFQYKKYHQARHFVKAAVLQAQTPGQRFLVTEFGREEQIHMMSVVSGKENSRAGLLFIENSYPVLKISPSIKEFKVEDALIMSIIRQESEFNQYARSHAGAMGLMQLIYPTAKDISRELGSKFTKSALYRDKHLNMKFGTFYLQKLLDYYDGSYILAICAYNAGQGNVDKWIKRFGDPRDLKTVEEVATWIEKIPFFETRGYVQNVLSNVQIYRNILRSKNKVSLLSINLAKDLLKNKKGTSS
ncbi:MAG: lytic transglycosylase domain-containing protein [Rickettsiales bacterium]|nr:lytic transglycosylase domain-containing protein [Rickettsiales bacterium]